MQLTWSELAVDTPFDSDLGLHNNAISQYALNFSTLLMEQKQFFFVYRLEIRDVSARSGPAMTLFDGLRLSQPVQNNHLVFLKQFDYRF